MAFLEKTRSTNLRNQKICPHTEFHHSSSKLWPMVSNFVFRLLNKHATRWRFFQNKSTEICKIQKHTHMQNFIKIGKKKMQVVPQKPVFACSPSQQKVCILNRNLATLAPRFTQSSFRCESNQQHSSQLRRKF